MSGAPSKILMPEEDFSGPISEQGRFVNNKQLCLLFYDIAYENILLFRILDFYGEYFGSPYSLPKMDLVSEEDVSFTKWRLDLCLSVFKGRKGPILWITLIQAVEANLLRLFFLKY